MIWSLLPTAFKRAIPLMVLLFLIPALVLISRMINVRPPDAFGERPLEVETIPSDRVVSNRVSGRLPQALYQLESLAVQSEWSPQMLRQAGDLWRDMGNPSEAVSYWERALQMQPGDVVLLRTLAQTYVELQRWADARERLAQLVEIVPEARWAHFELGLILAAFDPQTAVIHLQEAADDSFYGDDALALLDVLADDPGDSLVGMRAGTVLAGQERWAYAELAFTQVASLQQPFPEALASVGLARDRQGKDGSRWIEQALALDPENAEVRLLEGLHLRAVGEYNGSLDALIQAAALDPENPALTAELSTAYRLVNDLPQAEYWLRIAVALSDDNPRFQQLLTLFYAEEVATFPAAGLEHLQQSIVILPNDPDVRAGFGWALHTLGQTENGLAEIETALRIAPNNPRTLLYKARILLDSDRPGEAIPLLQQVIATESPYADEAQQILNNLGA